MTKVPDPDNDKKMYPVHILILSLEALEKPIADVPIAEEDMSSVKPRHGWRCRRLHEALARPKLLVLLHLLLILQQDQWMKITGTSM